MVHYHWPCDNFDSTQPPSNCMAGSVCISLSLFIAADQSRIMQDQMTGMAMGMPQDPSKAFKVCLSIT